MNVTRESFMEMLAACYNICTAAEPGNKLGKDMTDTALEAANALFDMIERKGKGHRLGVLLTVRLLAEVSCAKDQERYAQGEAQRGWDGARHEDAGATIALPAMGRCGTANRTAIVQLAIDGLTEYYPKLGKPTFAAKIARKVVVPDTGNAQADYENVRNQIELFLNKRRKSFEQIG
jgi:hypothetical protein